MLEILSIDHLLKRFLFKAIYLFFLIIRDVFWCRLNMVHTAQSGCGSPTASRFECRAGQSKMQGINESKRKNTFVFVRD